MRIGQYQEYILAVAEQRLRLNKHRKGHVSHWGDQLEKIGAAGELAARLLLSASPTKLSNGFDDGVDLYWRGYAIDVKSIMPTKPLGRYNLRIPVTSSLTADIFLLMAADVEEWKAFPIGWAWREEVAQAPINLQAYNPCRDIPVPELHRLWELYDLDPKLSPKAQACAEIRQ
jgi:hypothetical protein